EAMAGNERRCDSARREQTLRRNAHRQDRRLRVLGQRELLFGSFEDQTAQPLAERRVGFLERVAAHREGVRERFAHADFLRALSWKNEGDHGWLPAAAAMSC